MDGIKIITEKQNLCEIQKGKNHEQRKRKFTVSKMITKDMITTNVMI